MKIGRGETLQSRAREGRRIGRQAIPWRNEPRVNINNTRRGTHALNGKWIVEKDFTK